jgi:NAD-dependent deacetylase
MVHAESCDVFLVVGSSLVVYPAAEMPSLAYRSGAKLIIINRGKTPYDSLADITIEENVATVVPAIVEEVKELLK